MHDYLFSHEQEKDNMFSNNSALVVEFYPFQAIANNAYWRIKGIIGWVAVRLDTRTYDALTASGSAEGMRTEGMLVESDGELAAESSKYLTAEVLIRLVSERHPSRNLVGYAASNLPILPSYYVDGIRQGGAPPIYMQVAAPRKTFLPNLPPTLPQPPLIQSQLPPPPMIQSQLPQSIITSPLPVRKNRLKFSKDIFSSLLIISFTIMVW